MVKYESGCVDCGFPCLHEGCPHYKVRVLICDKCKDEVSKLYISGEDELCLDCLLDGIETIE